MNEREIFVMSFGRRQLVTHAGQIDPDTWAMAVALPAQVGRFIGDIDEGGAPHAAPAEAAAITAFLRQAMQKFTNIPLIATLCGAALAQTVINPLQEEALFNRVHDVMYRLAPALNPLEINAYKLLLVEMAEAVARAAPDRDEGAYNLMNGANEGWLGLYPTLMNNMMRYGRGPRVSTIEKLAINRLIDVLQADYLVEKWQLMDDTRQNVRVYG